MLLKYDQCISSSSSTCVLQKRFALQIQSTALKKIKPYHAIKIMKYSIKKRSNKRRNGLDVKPMLSLHLSDKRFQVWRANKPMADVPKNSHVSTLLFFIRLNTHNILQKPNLSSLINNKLMFP